MFPAFSVALLFSLLSLLTLTKADDVLFLGFPENKTIPLVGGTRIQFQFRPLLNDVNDYFPLDTLRLTMDSPFRGQVPLTDVEISPPLVKGVGFFTVRANLPDLPNGRWFAYIKIKQRLFPFIYHTLAETPQFRYVPFKEAARRGLINVNDLANTIAQASEGLDNLSA